MVILYLIFNIIGIVLHFLASLKSLKRMTAQLSGGKLESGCFFLEEPARYVGSTKRVRLTQNCDIELVDKRWALDHIYRVLELRDSWI